MKMCAFSFLFIFFLPSPSAFPLAFRSPFLLSLLITLSPFFYLYLPCCPLLSLTFLPFLYSTFLFSTFIPLHFSLPSPFHLSISLLLPLSLFFYFSSSILLHILLLLFYLPALPFPSSISTSLHPFLYSLSSISYPPPCFLCNLFLSSLSPFQIIFLSFFGNIPILLL